MSDSSMDGLIRKTVSNRMREKPEGCADENIIAAYLEGSLSPRETADFEEHASHCASCQEILALSMKLQDQETFSPAVEEKTARKKTLFHFSIPIPVLGGVFVVVILVAVLFQVFRDTQEKVPNLQTAELHTPAREAEMMERTISPPVEMKSRSVPEPEAPEPEAFLQTEKTKEYADLDLKDVETESTPHLPDTLIAEGKGAMIEESSPQELVGATSLGAEDKLDTPLVRSDIRTARSSMPPATRTFKEETAKITEIPADSSEAEELAASIPPSVKDELNKPLSSEEVSDQMSELSDLALSTSPSPLVSKQKARKMEFKAARARASAVESRKIGDKVFYNDSGLWIDRQCTQHPDDPVIEITDDDANYTLILERYPGLNDLIPVKIYWDNKTYLLR